MKVYDKAKWHKEEIAHNKQLAYVHIGFFLAWCLNRGFAGQLFTDDADEDFQHFIKGKITGPQLIELLDGVLDNEMLNDEANEFAEMYYDNYLDQYEQIFQKDGGFYSILDTNENYNRAEKLIDKLYSEWSRLNG